MTPPLTDTDIAVFLAQRGSEEVEFTEPKQAVEDAGASVDVVGAETGEAETVNDDLDPGGTYEIDTAFSAVSADDYDALVVPGGTVGADRLRANEEAVDLLAEFFDASKPAGVICHGPWTLVEAGIVEGRTLTSYPSLQTDVRNAGGDWVDEEVVTDGNLVTSRKPDDLDAFCSAVVDAFADANQ